MADFKKQFEGYRLLTANILYHMPDQPSLLQEFIWQDYDIPPRFPGLIRFLDFWTREIDGKLHSVYIANRKIITSSDYRHAGWENTLQ